MNLHLYDFGEISDFDIRGQNMGGLDIKKLMERLQLAR